jgi:hypothetical protein
MFKYSPINSYSLQNLQQSQIYFSNPLNFNDPFDTFHPATINELSNEKFANLYCKSNKRNFNEQIILKILDKTISRSHFHDFCKEHIDYFFDFDKDHKNPIYRSKENYLHSIEQRAENSLSPELEEVFTHLKTNLQNVILRSIRETREEKFSKIGVCCFSKNNSNLLMWSHYADSHKGFCLEFDSNIEPFEKNFDVIYNPDIPTIESDLLFDEENKFESFKKLLSFKSKDWEHEEELRVLHKEKNKNFRYPRYALKAIYFGIKTNQYDIEIVCSLIRTHNPSVRFYRMERLASRFGIKPEEFFYSTPVEVQSKLLIEISNSFKKDKFKLEDLLEIVKIHINENNLRHHLEEFVRLGLLEKAGNYYKIKA